MIGSAKKLLAEASARRAGARAALRGNWACAVFAAFLVGILSGEGTALESIIRVGSGPLIRFSVPTALRDLLDYAFDIPAQTVFRVSAAMLVAGLLLSGMMELGSVRYNLGLIDRRPAGIRDIFTGIPRFADALVMHLLRTVLLQAGFLLLAVPGVVMSCGLALAPYILAEDPECRGAESLRRSWELMRGRKLELLTLELSFLGWTLLSVFSLGIGPLFLNPYRAAARADFYRKLSAQA